MIKKRLEKLENEIESLISKDTNNVSTLTPEERHYRIAELVHKMGEYNGYKFIPIEDYNSLNNSLKAKYISEVTDTLKEWFNERKSQVR